ncbi:unnamed protein product [Mortierella alpina]
MVFLASAQGSQSTSKQNRNLQTQIFLPVLFWVRKMIAAIFRKNKKKGTRKGIQRSSPSRCCAIGSKDRSSSRTKW